MEMASASNETPQQPKNLVDTLKSIKKDSPMKFAVITLIEELSVKILKEIEKNPDKISDYIRIISEMNNYWDKHNNHKEEIQHNLFDGRPNIRQCQHGASCVLFGCNFIHPHQRRPDCRFGHRCKKANDKSHLQQYNHPKNMLNNN